jgi:hypothetical protein
MLATLSALQHAYDTKDDALGREISFVVQKGATQLSLKAVKWSDPLRRMGREAAVDSSFKVKYVVTKLFGKSVPEVSFENDDIVLPRAGVEAKRYAGKLADQLPLHSACLFKRLSLWVSLRNKDEDGSLLV